MDRNDLLRELELLPAWRLKKAEQADIEASTKTILVEPVKVSIAQKNTEHEPIIVQATIRASKQKVAVLVYLDQPKTDHFYETELGLLLDNMLKAIQLKRGDNVAVIFESSELHAYEAQLFLVLGEQAAQHLLAKNLPMQQLRGKLHELADKRVIVSHDLAHLLLYPHNKRDTWQDLKLLKTMLNNLQSS